KLIEDLFILLPIDLQLSSHVSPPSWLLLKYNSWPLDQQLVLLGLKYVPDHSTLCRAYRLSKALLERLLESLLQKALNPRRVHLP
ncbi:hypothetical protein DRN93_05235, partial [archaeon]